MAEINCVARRVINKSRDQSENLGKFFVSARPVAGDESLRFVVVSLHGAVPGNENEAYHFAFYPEMATQIANAILDITEGPVTDE